MAGSLEWTSGRSPRRPVSSPRRGSRSPAMKSREVISELRSRANPADLEGMARFGIATDRALGGSSIPYLRWLAKRLGKDHRAAAARGSAWIVEARIRAGLVDAAAAGTEEQMEAWAAEFVS